MDHRNGNWDIYEKDLPNGQEQRLTLTGDNEYPDISGDRVVWRAFQNNQWDIYSLDLGLTDPTPQPVTNDSAFEWSVRVSGDLIVWMDGRNNTDPTAQPGASGVSWDIYMKDLTSGAEIKLADRGTNAYYPAVDGETAVWEEYASSIWEATIPDTTAPAVSNLNPAGGAATDCTAPAISASYTDNRVGVNARSVVLNLDGQEVTGAAAITDSGVSYQPDTLTEVTHSVSLEVTDFSGNTATSDWQFTIAPPLLHMNNGKAFWANYGDYSHRLLTVPYQIANASVDFSVIDVEILALPATEGVILHSATPVAVGDATPGSQAGFSLKYLVPNSTNTFKATVFASAKNRCGGIRYLPGPPSGV